MTILIAILMIIVYSNGIKTYVYKPNWIKTYANVKLGKCTHVSLYFLVSYMFTWGFQVWRSISEIVYYLKGTVTSVDKVNVIFRLGVAILSCYCIFVFVFFLCQQTISR